VGDVREFWEAHDAWRNRIDLARKAERFGDFTEACLSGSAVCTDSSI
jgi:hypothetical protein